MLFEWALRAGLPVIGVRTDDLVSLPKALQLIAAAPNPVLRWDQNSKVQLGKQALMWTTESSWVTIDVARTLGDKQQTLVVVNPDQDNLLIFDGGIMPAPTSMLQEYLAPVCSASSEGPYLAVLKGLSLKAAKEVVEITEARTGALTVQELRKTRSILSGHTRGLTLVDTSYDFYEMPAELKAWLADNVPYFLHPPHERLTPRGLLLDGPQGTGKTMASKAIANAFDVPLYRLDIASVLTKFVGDSEERMERALSLLDREEVCVALIDETDKLFSTEGLDAGVTQRLLSQLLWWLQEHRSRVFTVLTTNHVHRLPPELYREGRIDRVIRTAPLASAEAQVFAAKVFCSIMGKAPSLSQQQGMKFALRNASQMPKPTYAHALVSQVVVETIKQKRWMAPLTNIQQ